MSYFDEVYKKLFPKKTKGPILHEVLKRSDAYLDQYDLWKDSSLPSELIGEIAESLRLKAEGIIKNPNVHQFSGESSNGFAITYNSDIDQMHFHFLFDLFAEKVKALDYRVSISDLIVTEKNGYVESKEKHYLKIKPAEQTPIDQKFGNIVIELIRIDEVPSFIRLMANTYNDHLYKSPKKFKELAEYLLQS
ncbi:MAG: hypothetical protein JXR03_16785 [Cyclobacteriaceae bacterium]